MARLARYDRWLSVQTTLAAVTVPSRHAQAEHERNIDRVIEQQRQRQLDEELRLDHENDLGFGIE